MEEIKKPTIVLNEAVDFWFTSFEQVFFFLSLCPQWKGEIQEFCPNTKMLLVGCKSDLRTDLSTLVELSNHRQTPVSYDQVFGFKISFYWY